MRRFLFLIVFLLQCGLVFSQVSINTQGTPPHPSAGLDVNFTDKGFLLPRMTFEQRNAIQSPADGLIIFCTNCGFDGAGVLSIYQNGIWREFNIDCVEPVKPSAGNRVPSTNSILWNWSGVPIALGYKFNTVNDISSAIDLGAQTSYLETGLDCWTTYTRYIWAYNDCGNSSSLTLTESTLEIPFSPAPTGAFHFADPSSIIWDWYEVSGATGYKWNITNDPATAIDLGNTSIYFEQGLNCLTTYTRYIWAYDDCGISSSTTISQTTLADPPNTPAAGTHVPAVTQITWNWSTSSDAEGYKINTTNNYSTATDLGNATTYAESGLTCNTPYNRYIWAYSVCGVTPSVLLSATTLPDPPPSPVAATHVPGISQIVWNWNSVTGATGYKWNTTNSYSTAIDVGAATFVIETGLLCNIVYTRYVWAYGPCGVSNVTTLSQSTSLSPPASPVAGTHVPTATQITWNWNTVPDADGYKWNTTSDYGTAQEMGANTTKLETGLSCNTPYTRYVWAYSECGVSAFSVLSQTTSLNPPPAPTAGTHPATPTQIIWNWNAVAGATGYKWHTSNDYANAQDMGATTSRTETGLTCNLPYTRYVWAYSNCGVSNATTLNQNTAQNPPSAPTAGTHVPQITQITWNWNTVAGAAGYKWHTSNDYANAQDMGTATTKVETGLLCNSAYTRYVWSYNNCGVSTSVSLTQATLQNPPASPLAGTHTSTVTQITWNWNAVAGAAGYRWNTVNNYSTASDMGTATTRTESGLTCNLSYTRYVWAYSSCGVSTSTALTFSTQQNPPAAPVAGTHNPSPTQVVWNWNTVSGAAGYRWNTTNDYASAENLGTATTKTETGLVCNTAYTRFVWAYNSCGVSVSTSLSSTTTNNPPPVPVVATHTSTPTQITWDWNPSAGATGYKFHNENNYTGATDLGNVTVFAESGLTCNTGYTRYVWAYNSCDNSAPLTMTFNTALDPPASPAAGSHVATLTTIDWNWNTVTGATGYKFNTTNDYGTAQEMGTSTTFPETGLTCYTSYNRYVWAYSSCGVSAPTTLTQMTMSDPPASPTAAVHVPLTDQVTWKWNPVTGVTGYKWNTENNYATATDMGTDTSRVETGLACNTNYTRFVWSYGACGPSTAISLTQTTLLDPPAAPAEGTHTPSYAQINWTWNTVPGAAGYRWNTTDDYGTALNVGSATSRLQTGLVCNTPYTSYVWAYNNCGNSITTAMTSSTTNAPPAAPTAGTHVSTLSSVTWNWNAVAGATGYKFNITNSYTGATDMGTATTFTETGLNCGTNYTRYIWSYNACGESTPLTTSKNTVNCWVCGDPLVISHVAGLVAPVNKTTTYNTVTNVPGLTTKCWITSNLGSSNQATSSSDNSEAAAGWYWQFNKKQGFKHDGTTRTPSTAWITFIPESVDWEASKDPCLIELGTGWRIPTRTEWEAVDAAGGWAGASGTYNSLLKLHMAGRIYPSTGNLSNRGSEGYYWSSIQLANPEQAWKLYIAPGSATVNNVDKTSGNTLRCIKD